MLRSIECQVGYWNNVFTRILQHEDKVNLKKLTEHSRQAERCRASCSAITKENSLVNKRIHFLCKKKTTKEETEERRAQETSRNKRTVKDNWK